MRIGFAGNLEKQGIAEYRAELSKQAGLAGHDCHSYDNGDEIKLAKTAPELLVVVGGDGSLLRFAAVAAELDIPVLGVNLGRIGFLSEIAVEDFPNALERILSGDYRVEKHMMLCCCVNGCECAHCLNDVLVFKQSFSGTIQVSLFCDGKDVGTVFCDGIIASTPTGSTAYNLSAGGPVVAQNLNAIAVTPVCSHTLHVRPIVTSADSVWSFHAHGDGFVAGDGIKLRKIGQSDTVVVTKSDRMVKFIRFTEQNVFELIHRKLS